jgi:RNA polymerase-binding transcription factor DksA
LQRLHARDQLTVLWRLTVDELTELSVRLHTVTYDADVDELSVLESRLAAARRTIVEVELALQKLRSGTYGHCDACECRIAAPVLALRPHHRYCPACDGAAIAATG